jgi:hypothetical protein
VKDLFVAFGLRGNSVPPEDLAIPFTCANRSGPKRSRHRQWLAVANHWYWYTPDSSGLRRRLPPRRAGYFRIDRSMRVIEGEHWLGNRAFGPTPKGDDLDSVCD